MDDRTDFQGKTIIGKSVALEMENKNQIFPMAQAMITPPPLEKI